jgi:hypothetical protein
MSRSRDSDVREGRAPHAGGTRPRGTRDPRPRHRHRSQDRPRDWAREPIRERPTRHVELPARGLTLPRTPTREPVDAGDRVYQLRESETRILATVGAFRVVPVTDLELGGAGRDMWHSDFQELARQGLIERKTVVINREPTPIVALTRDGQRLLEAHQETRTDGRHQRYHAGFVKPREVAHDAQLYRLYQAEAARLEDAGGRVSRVVLDYELKRDYQTFLHRKDRPEDVTNEDDMRTFATERALPIIDDHLELPDLRIEYETRDGGYDVRDVELVTQHYSRGQLAGKSRAGFALYRAVGGARNGGKAGGTPFDPHYLELLT